MRVLLILVGAAMAVAVGVVSVYALIPASQLAVNHYVVVDADTLVISTVTGDGQTLRVDVAESPTEVRLTVNSFTWPFGAKSDLGRDVELAVELDAPLGDRPVVDSFHTVPTKADFENAGP